MFHPTAPCWEMQDGGCSQLENQDFHIAVSEKFTKFGAWTDIGTTFCSH